MWTARSGARTAARRFWLGFLALTLLAAGCTSAAGSTAASGGPSITVAVIPAADNAPAMIAAKDGVFRDHGLNVTVKTYNSVQSEVQALKNGSVDIAAGDYTDFLYADVVGKASLHLAADGYDATPNVMEVLSRPGSGITTPQDLVHKVVATPEPQLIPPGNGVPYNIETLATQTVLNSDGITPTDVTWKPMPEQNMIRALSSGHVNAILATEPTLIQAQAQLGAVEVMDSCSGPTAGLPLSGYFSLAAYASAHRAQLQHFRAALASAQANATSGGSLQAMLPHLTGMSSQDAALVTIGSYPTSLSVRQVQRVADLMLDSGVISTSLNVTKLASG
jgi:NitT/TauT family transport system substrate-binding protein